MDIIHNIYMTLAAQGLSKIYPANTTPNVCLDRQADRFILTKKFSEIC